MQTTGVSALSLRLYFGLSGLKAYGRTRRSTWPPGSKGRLGSETWCLIPAEPNDTFLLPSLVVVVPDGSKPPPVGFCGCASSFAWGTVVCGCIRALGLRDLRRILPSSPPDFTEAFSDSVNAWGVGLSVRSFSFIGTGCGTGNGNGTGSPVSTGWGFRVSNFIVWAREIQSSSPVAVWTLITWSFVLTPVRGPIQSSFVSLAIADWGLLT